MKIILFVPFSGGVRVQKASFSTTLNLFSRKNHVLYPQIDWDRVAAGNYAIVDPFDPQAIQYFSERDYKVMVRVAMSNQQTLVILARPEDAMFLSSDG